MNASIKTQTPDRTWQSPWFSLLQDALPAGGSGALALKIAVVLPVTRKADILRVD